MQETAIIFPGPWFMEGLPTTDAMVPSQSAVSQAFLAPGTQWRCAGSSPGYLTDGFLARKMEKVNSERRYRRKIGYLETYLTEARGIESTDDLTSKDSAGYGAW